MLDTEITRELPIDEAVASLKTPPHSVEAEQSVLGGLMLDNEAWDKVGDKITADDFYNPAHRHVFAVVQALAQESLPFDPVTVSEEMDRQGVLEEAGGILYLTELVESIPSVANLAAYGDIVYERSVLRRLISASQRIAESAYVPEGRKVDDIVEMAEREVFNIAESRAKEGGPVGARELLKKAVEKIDELYKTTGSITGVTSGFKDLDEMTSGFQSADMIVVAARPSMGKCIVAGSRVLDPETGQRTLIDDIIARKQGALLSLGDDFRITPATPSAFVDDGVKPVFKVTTALGRTIETTLTHPFLTDKGWLPLGKIKEGDVVAVPRQLPVFGKNSLPDHEVRALAYFIGDGGTTQSSVRFTNADKRVLDDFTEAMQGFGNVKCILVESSKRTPSLRVSSDGELVTEARQQFAGTLNQLLVEKSLTGKALADQLGLAESTVSYWRSGSAVPEQNTVDNLCGALNVSAEDLFPEGYEEFSSSSLSPVAVWLEKHGLLNCLATDKVLPDAVFELPKSQIALFLRHLFACDGSAFVQGNGQCRISYASSSEELIRGVQHLLIRFGINARVRSKKNNYEGAATSWELAVLSQSGLQTFIDEIGIFSQDEAVESVRQTLSGKQPHDNSDTLPASLCDYILKIKGNRSWPEIFSAAGKECPANYNPHLSGVSRRGLSRARTAMFAELFRDDYLRNLSQSDVYWDTVVSIESQGDKQVYDLTVDQTHNFIAEDIFVHNTTFAMNLIENALMSSDECVVVFSLEMPGEALMMRSLSSLGRIDQSKVRTGKLEDEDWPKLSNAVKSLKEKKLFIDDTAGISPQEMRTRLRRINREHGKIAMVMIDYLQLMQIPGFSEGRTNEISEISRSIKAMAKEFECPVIALSQLNRSLEQRPNKRPVNSDLRESGAIEQDADVIMFIYRDEVYNPDTEHKGVAEIIIGKQRNGPIGSIRLAFLGRFTRFENLAPEAYGNFVDD